MATSETMKEIWRRRGNWRVRLSVRFWAKVNKEPGQGPNGDCWEWQGASDKRGYGSFPAIRPEEGFNTRRAHTVSYLLAKGPTNGLNVCHSCDNPRCVNPAHLWLGTQLQNMRDASQKGRMLQPQRRVSETVQRAIRESSGRYADIAHKFNVSTGIVSLIKNNNYPDRVRRQAHKGRPPKFTREEIRQIRAASGLYRDIAARFNTSSTSVGRIKRGLVSKFVEASA